MSPAHDNAWTSGRPVRGPSQRRGEAVDEALDAGVLGEERVLAHDGAPGLVVDPPGPEPLREEDRLATDSKVWPAQ